MGLPLLYACAVLHGTAAASAQPPAILYLYDDLNRLVRVIDATGQAATYHYDAVGNILRITREVVPHTTTVDTVSDSTLLRGATETVDFTGFNFSGAVVTGSAEITAVAVP